MAKGTNMLEWLQQETGQRISEPEPDPPRSDRHVSFRLSLSDHDELSAIAEAQRKKVSQLLRDLVQAELHRNRGLRELDAQALAAQLGGLIAEVQRRLVAS